MTYNKWYCFSPSNSYKFITQIINSDNLYFGWTFYGRLSVGKFYSLTAASMGMKHELKEPPLKDDDKKKMIEDLFNE